MLYISSVASQHKYIVDVIEEFVSNEIFNIELSGNLKYYKDWEKDLINLKEKYDLKLLMHNYFPPVKGEQFVLNYATTDNNIRKRTLELFKNAISLMDKISIPIYSMHPGYRSDCTPAKGREPFGVKWDNLSNRETAYDNFYNTIDLMLLDISKAGGRLAVENMFPYPPEPGSDINLISTPSDIKEFVDYAKNKDGLGFLFDLGHFNICSRIRNFNVEQVANDIFSQFSEKIFEIHLSENDSTGDHHNITPNDSWQLKTLKEFSDAVKKVPIVLEWDNKGSTKEIAKAYKSISKILTS